MKTTKTIFSLILISFVLINPLSAQKTLKKKHSESFSNAAKSTLVFDTKFADINLVNHPSSTVDVLVKIEVKGKNEEKASALLKKIDVSIEKDGNEILIKNTSKNMLNVGGDISIIIDVKAPVSVGLDMNASYGDVSIAQIDGETNIKMTYGSFEAARLLHDQKDQPVSLDISYCNPVMIGMVKHADMMLSYSKMKMRAAGVLRLDSEYSEVEIEKIINLSVTSDYGSLELDEVSNIFAKSNHSGFLIKTINKIADFYLKYGSLKIDQVLKPTESIKIDAEYSSIRLAGLENISLRGETSNSQLQLPSWVEIQEKSVVQKSLSGGNGNTKLDIEIEYGNLIIHE
ncbi:MAG: hypothetical protein R6V52_12275 [Bacteroidales bacterium]